MRSISTAGVPRSSSCSMMHSASVVLPEPEPPSTAAWRFSTSLLSVMLLLDFCARPARMLVAPLPASSSSTDSGSSWLSCAGGMRRAGRRRASTRARRWPALRSPRRSAQPCRLASALPLASLRPNRSSRSSCTSARISDSSLARWNQSAKPGSLRCWAWNSRTVIMRSQSGIGTSTERPPASRNLRKACAVWFFLLGGKSLARSMKQLLSFMAGSTRSSWRLRPPPCVGPVAQEDAALGGKARLVPQASGRWPAARRTARAA